MSPTFDLLYLFENREMFILEIKRTDMPLEATKADIYKWMLIDKDNLKMTPLEFLSRAANDLMEERFFRQGYLSFDSDQAIFIRESSSVQNILRHKDAEQIPRSLVTCIQQRLSI